MTSKKQYYELDDIGFVGTQEKRTEAQVKKDIDMTVEYIKAQKDGNVIPLPRKNTNRLLKVK